MGGMGDLAAKRRVLEYHPQAYISKVIWPCEIYWVMANRRAKDSMSVGKPTESKAWADAARRLPRKKR